MKYQILHKDDVKNLTNGTFRVGTLNQVTYRELLNIFGPPTYYPEDSADGKVKFEWVLFNGKDVFTVYDYKTYDEDYTRNELTTWSVGGKTDPYDVTRQIYKALNEVNTEAV